MVNYTLYLDESATHSGQFADNVFCMAGIIIKDDLYCAIESDLNKLKETVWHDLTTPHGIILHQMQITQAIKSKQDLTLKIDNNYKRFKQNKNCKELYTLLGKVFDKNEILTIGATLDIAQLNKYFTCGNEPDPYLIALQLLLENYCHFLCNNSGKRKILYESRSPNSDQQLKDRFYHIKLMGSMYISKKTMEKRLTAIEFQRKDMNNAGLQLADFVPNYFARKYKKFKPKKFNIDNQLRKSRYDGGLELRDRFGVKNMP